MWHSAFRAEFHVYYTLAQDASQEGNEGKYVYPTPSHVCLYRQALGTGLDYASYQAMHINSPVEEPCRTILCWNNGKTTYIIYRYKCTAVYAFVDHETRQ